MYTKNGERKMNDHEIQNTDIQRPKEKYANTTTVRINKVTRDFLLKHELRLASLVHFAPLWYERMLQLQQEENSIKEGIRKKDAMIAQLWQENAELREFKAKAVERWKVK